MEKSNNTFRDSIIRRRQKIFFNRKKGIISKMHQLSTLTDIEGFLLIINENKAYIYSTELDYNNFLLEKLNDPNIIVKNYFTRMNYCNDKDSDCSSSDNSFKLEDSKLSNNINNKCTTKLNENISNENKEDRILYCKKKENNKEINNKNAQQIIENSNKQNNELFNEHKNSTTKPIFNILKKNNNKHQIANNEPLLSNPISVMSLDKSKKLSTKSLSKLELNSPYSLIKKSNINNNLYNVTNKYYNKDTNISKKKLSCNSLNLYKEINSISNCNNINIEDNNINYNINKINNNHNSNGLLKLKNLTNRSVKTKDDNSTTAYSNSKITDNTLTVFSKTNYLSNSLKICSKNNSNISNNIDVYSYDKDIIKGNNIKYSECSNNNNNNKIFNNILNNLSNIKTEISPDNSSYFGENSNKEKNKNAIDSPIGLNNSPTNTDNNNNNNNNITKSSYNQNIFDFSFDKTNQKNIINNFSNSNNHNNSNTNYSQNETLLPKLKLLKCQSNSNSLNMYNISIDNNMSNNTNNIFEYNNSLHCRSANPLSNKSLIDLSNIAFRSTECGAVNNFINHNATTKNSTLFNNINSLSRSNLNSIGLTFNIDNNEFNESSSYEIYKNDDNKDVYKSMLKTKRKLSDGTISDKSFTN